MNERSEHLEIQNDDGEDVEELLGEDEDKKTDPVALQKFLEGIDYPVPKQKLIKHAEKREVGPLLLAKLEELPEGNYSSPIDISRALDELDE